MRKVVDHRNKGLFTKAKNISECSDFQECKLGCVVVLKNKIIGMGFNCSKTHPLQKKYNKERFQEDCSPHSMHAELHALSPIVNMDLDWSKVELYIYRAHKNGQIAMARPCKSCMALIKDLGIRHIHYTTEDGYASELIEKGLPGKISA